MSAAKCVPHLRGKREEGRGKKLEGRRKREEGRRKMSDVRSQKSEVFFVIVIVQHYPNYTLGSR